MATEWEDWGQMATMAAIVALVLWLIASLAGMSGCAALNARGPTTVPQGDAITGQVAIDDLRTEFVALQGRVGELNVGDSTWVATILATGMVGLMALFIRSPQDAWKRWRKNGQPRGPPVK